MSIKITSAAFAADQQIPEKYTADGTDLSPPLRWEGVPKGTRELVLICDDPDAPTPTPWVHWVLYKIPSGVVELPEGIPARDKLEFPAGAMQGKNSFTSGHTVGYRGPAPPPGHGVHHYHFRLYALDSPLTAQPGLDKDALLQAMSGKVLGGGELVGTYQR
jgi:Raf kinase inhibitor-like YbhB/YbcL family protein